MALKLLEQRIQRILHQRTFNENLTRHGLYIGTGFFKEAKFEFHLGLFSPNMNGGMHCSRNEDGHPAPVGRGALLLGQSDRGHFAYLVLGSMCRVADIGVALWPDNCADGG